MCQIREILRKRNLCSAIVRLGHQWPNKKATCQYCEHDIVSGPVGIGVGVSVTPC